LLAVLARLVDRHGERKAALAAGSGAVIALLLWLTLAIRQWFQGTYLDGAELGSAELYAYSVAWILAGVALLIAGFATQGSGLRYASLAVMVAAIGKVFLVDAAALSGLYRVFSFLGLGLSLIGLGYLYSRFVFALGAHGKLRSDEPGS